MKLPWKYRDDVEAWLEPMNYEQFWREIKPWCLPMPYTRAECDEDIASGVPFEDVMGGLKVIAGHLLIRRHGLKSKPIGPVLRVAGSDD